MAKEHEWRDPVFVRVDDESHVKASVVVWNEQCGGVSVMLKNSHDQAVLIQSKDWATLVACVNADLARVD